VPVGMVLSTFFLRSNNPPDFFGGVVIMTGARLLVCPFLRGRPDENPTTITKIGWDL